MDKYLIKVQDTIFANKNAIIAANRQFNVLNTLVTFTDMASIVINVSVFALETSP